MEQTVTLKHSLNSLDLRPLFFRNLVSICRGVSIPADLSALILIDLLNCLLYLLPNLHLLHLLYSILLYLLFLNSSAVLHAFFYFKVLAQNPCLTQFFFLFQSLLGVLVLFLQLQMERFCYLCLVKSVLRQVLLLTIDAFVEVSNHYSQVFLPSI